MSDVGGAYAGDIAPREAWAALSADGAAALVDVRTRAEWSFVGVPDLSPLGKQAILQEWQSYPTMQVDGGFAVKVASVLTAAGATPETPVYFLCRSGARSQAAAAAMAALGWRRCYNVAGGFEGPLDGDEHRGGKAGWKSDDLPWVQS